jgi:hypothetical protein
MAATDRRRFRLLKRLKPLGDTAEPMFCGAAPFLVTVLPAVEDRQTHSVVAQTIAHQRTGGRMAVAWQPVP